MNQVIGNMDDGDPPSNGVIGWQGTDLSNCIFFQNIQSLKAKFSKLKDDLPLLRGAPLAICLQETWSPSPYQMKLPGYQKLTLRSRTKRGGGVGIFLQNG